MEKSLGLLPALSSICSKKSTLVSEMNSETEELPRNDLLTTSFRMSFLANFRGNKIVRNGKDNQIKPFACELTGKAVPSTAFQLLFRFGKFKIIEIDVSSHKF